MRFLCFVSLFFFIHVSVVKSQITQRWALGFNLSENIVNWYLFNYKNGKGYHFEPSVYYKISELLYVKGSVGFSKISSVHTLSETDVEYLNKGSYIRIGLLSGFSKSKELVPNALGISVFYCNYNEVGDFRIKGPYFSDYTSKYSFSNQEALIIEPTAEILALKLKHFLFTCSITYPIIVYNSIQSDYPNFFIPGYGTFYTGKLFDWGYMLYRFDFTIVVPINRK